MDCETLKQYHLNAPNISKFFKRSPESILKYEELKQKLKDGDTSLCDYIILRHFISKQFDWAFVPNDFPYVFSEDISHYVLWINPLVEYSEEQITTLIHKLVDKEVIYFRNPPMALSVSGVVHYHVFIRN